MNAMPLREKRVATTWRQRHFARTGVTTWRQRRFAGIRAKTRMQCRSARNELRHMKATSISENTTRDNMKATPLLQNRSDNMKATPLRQNTSDNMKATPLRQNTSDNMKATPFSRCRGGRRGREWRGGWPCRKRACLACWRLWRRWRQRRWWLVGAWPRTRPNDHDVRINDRRSRLAAVWPVTWPVAVRGRGRGRSGGRGRGGGRGTAVRMPTGTVQHHRPRCQHHRVGARWKTPRWWRDRPLGGATAARTAGPRAFQRD